MTATATATPPPDAAVAVAVAVAVKVEVPAPAPADPCTTSCSQLASACGLSVPSCAIACAHRPDVASCFADAHKSCEQLGACALLIDCHVAPAGSSTCATVVQQAASCDPSERDCRCTGIASLAPAGAAAYAAWDLCVAQCHGDPVCPHKTCIEQLTVCKAR